MTSPSFFWPGRGSGSEVIVILPPAQTGPRNSRIRGKIPAKNQIRVR
jgi:hypothetical protein